jgi:hypothetical protein
MRDQNYATVPEFQPWPTHDPGWFMLEWDIALDRCDRERFTANALDRPGRVRVAPYMLYPAGHRPVQCHRTAGKPIPEGQPHADTFGFGCIYFPQLVLDELWNGPMPKRLARQGVLNDTIFSEWHLARFGPVDVDWTVHPQHLHGD